MQRHLYKQEYEHIVLITIFILWNFGESEGRSAQVGVNRAPLPIPLGELMETNDDSEFVQPHLHGTDLARCRDNAGRGTQVCLHMPEDSHPELQIFHDIQRAT